MRTVAKAFGIEIIVPFTLTLNDGSTVEADALIKHFGRRNGTLVFDHAEALDTFSSRIF